MHDTFNLHGISVEYYIPAKCQGIRTFLPVDSIDTCAAIGEPVTGLHKGFSRPVGESHGQMGNLMANFHALNGMGNFLAASLCLHRRLA